ncbi:OprO/OprP family phosphate-selective porin [Methylobacillus flagellatus]|uniref:OprO/OprP family phosphate-selective porin n=1 Tax=Methylobacillus flagellatus TaxID=405 RepID=UPI0010F9A630|nr:porin [Methylobacillus flagellatus]
MTNFKVRSLLAAVSGALLLSAGGTAMADSTDDIVNALIAKGVLTEEEGALLMKGREGEKEAAAKKKETAISAGYKDGIVFSSGDGKTSMAINGRVHADYRAFNYDEDDNGSAGLSSNGADTFDIRRARLGAKVKFLDYYEAEVVANLSGGSTTMDVAYLNISWFKNAQLRFGQFKMPFSLEQLTSSNNIDFVERSFVDAYVPAKEVGAMMHGAPFTGFTYGVAASTGRGINSAENDVRVDDVDLIGRATINFAEIMGDKNMVLHAGLAAAKGDISKGDAAAAFGGNRSTEARGASFFSAPVVNTPAGADASIDRTRVGLEGAAAYGPFKLQAQYLTSSFDFDTATRGYDVDINTWYAEALWTLTGETHASRYKGGAFGALKPTNNFDPVKFTGGAWELGLRYSKFDASDFNTIGLRAGAGQDGQVGTGASRFSEANSWTMGVKFVANPHVRFMLDFVQTDFENNFGGNVVTVNGKPENDEKALLLRTQFTF